MTSLAENQEIQDSVERPETKHYYLTLLNGTEQQVIQITQTFLSGQELIVLHTIIKILVHQRKKQIQVIGEQFTKKHMILIVRIRIHGKYQDIAKSQLGGKLFMVRLLIQVKIKYFGKTQKKVLTEYLMCQWFTTKNMHDQT